MGVGRWGRQLLWYRNRSSGNWVLHDAQAIGCNGLRWRSLASFPGPARRQQYNQNQAHYVPELPVQSLLLKGLPPARYSQHN